MCIIMQKQKKRGFTLIELIVVVAILVALLLILVPRLTGFTSTAAEVPVSYTHLDESKRYRQLRRIDNGHQRSGSG